MFRRSSVIATLILSACATAPAVPPDVAAPPSTVDGAGSPAPAPSPRYVTAPQPDGIVGGPRAALLAKKIREALQARGDQGEPDGALAAAATWLAGQRAGASELAIREVALRAGFPGAVASAAAFQVDGGDDLWRRALGDVASNLPITRYGVHVTPDGVATVVFGRMEVRLDPFPRRFRPGEACRLRGEVAARYDRARVYLTRPDGKVDETPLSGRTIDVSLPLSGPGKFQVEVMGDGASGPVLLANVPIYVGVNEPPWPAAAAPPSSDDGRPVAPADAETRMLTLLNEVRRAAGLPALTRDPELRAVAIGHTEDMMAARFFGHVSPTTGTVESRLQRAGVIVSLCGENIAQADNADGAHRVLMDSPAHRANMLGAKFTHVGIGVGVRPGDANDLLATLVFARRPPPPATPVTPAVATSFVSSLRRAKSAAPIRVDPVLQKAAEAGIAALKGDGPVVPDKALAAAHDALVQESKRLHVGHHAICIELVQVLELDELEQDHILLQQPPMTVGLATATRQIGQAVKIFVLVVADGAKCH